jgi:hypothetical protein
MPQEVFSFTPADENGGPGIFIENNPSAGGPGEGVATSYNLPFRGKHRINKWKPGYGLL